MKGKSTVLSKDADLSENNLQRIATNSYAYMSGTWIKNEPKSWVWLSFLCVMFKVDSAYLDIYACAFKYMKNG